MLVVFVVNKIPYEKQQEALDAVEELRRFYKDDEKAKIMFGFEYDHLNLLKNLGYKLTKSQRTFVNAYQEYNIQVMMLSYIRIVRESRIKKPLKIKFKHGLENFISKIKGKEAVNG